MGGHRDVLLDEISSILTKKTTMNSVQLLWCYLWYSVKSNKIDIITGMSWYHLMSSDGFELHGFYTHYVFHKRHYLMAVTCHHTTKCCTDVQTFSLPRTLLLLIFCLQLKSGEVLIGKREFEAVIWVGKNLGFSGDKPKNHSLLWLQRFYRSCSY